jgi:hypothetical protein
MGPREPVQLEIVDVARHPQIRAQQRLNRLQSRCGCAAGAVAVLASIAIGALRVYTRHAGAPSWSLLWECFAVLVAAFVIGLVTKLGVLVVTRWQFAYECRAQGRVLGLAFRGDANDVHLHALGR